MHLKMNWYEFFLLVTLSKSISTPIKLTASLAKGIEVKALVKSNDLAEGLIELKDDFNGGFIYWNKEYEYLSLLVIFMHLLQSDQFSD